jgi:hypothetical protein
MGLLDADGLNVETLGQSGDDEGELHLRQGTSP